MLVPTWKAMEHSTLIFNRDPDSRFRKYPYFRELVWGFFKFTQLLADGRGLCGVYFASSLHMVLDPRSDELVASRVFPFSSKILHSVTDAPARYQLAYDKPLCGGARCRTGDKPSLPRQSSHTSHIVGPHERRLTLVSSHNLASLNAFCAKYPQHPMELGPRGPKSSLYVTVHLDGQEILGRSAALEPSGGMSICRSVGLPLFSSESEVEAVGCLLVHIMKAVTSHRPPPLKSKGLCSALIDAFLKAFAVVGRKQSMFPSIYISIRSNLRTSSSRKYSSTGDELPFCMHMVSFLAYLVASTSSAKTVFSRRPSGEIGPRTLPSNCLRDKPRNHGRRSVHKDRAAREKSFGTSMAVDDRTAKAAMGRKGKK
ncbi:hypothetical protein K438DRAFT_1779334 [Mycena galopus ATCC 62051]|nr:hypothetical protein K438DRAFT_1779334 [Mycena galopus ATCC 62051]